MDGHDQNSSFLKGSWKIQRCIRIHEFAEGAAGKSLSEQALHDFFPGTASRAPVGQADEEAGENCEDRREGREKDIVKRQDHGPGEEQNYPPHRHNRLQHGPRDIDGCPGGGKRKDGNERHVNPLLGHHRLLHFVGLEGDEIEGVCQPTRGIQDQHEDGRNRPDQNSGFKISHELSR